MGLLSSKSGSFDVSDPNTVVVAQVNGELKEKIPPQSPVESPLLCGYGRWKPKCLQVFHRPACLLISLCVSSIAQGMLINGLIPTSLSNLERRFHLSSTQSGIFASMYDVAVVIMLIPVCHFGAKGHKGHWLGIGMTLLGLGAFICTLPQFTTGPYFVENNQTDTCLAGTSVSSCSKEETKGADVSNYLYVFILGQILHGAGAAPLYTLGITYIDENVSQKTSPLFTGIFLAFAVVGPAIGFVAGGALLNIYGDIGKVDLARVTLTNDDPRWYGAWWIGYLASGCLAVLCSIPLLGFARELPGAKEHRKKDINQAYHLKSNHGSNDGVGFGDSLTDIPKNCLKLLKNRTYMCLVVMQVFEGFLLTGFTTFVPKVMENIFNISSSKASMMTGAVVVPGGFFGNLLGGFIIKKFRLRCSGIIMVGLVCQLISFCLIFVFLIRCPQAEFAGLNKPFVDGDPVPGTEGTTISNKHLCNADCGCSDFYNPVCSHENAITYYSPCFAGCAAADPRKHIKAYLNCSCVLSFNGTKPLNSTGVEVGVCETDCGHTMPVFLIFFGLLVLVTFTAAIPIQQATLRCVDFSQRNMALGLDHVFVRLVGSIPGAILFGKAIDEACSMWQDSCGVRASCLRYDSKLMTLYILGFGLCLKLGMIVSLCLAWKFYRDSVALVGDSCPTVSRTVSAKRTDGEFHVNGALVNGVTNGFMTTDGNGNVSLSPKLVHRVHSTSGEKL